MRAGRARRRPRRPRQEHHRRRVGGGRPPPDDVDLGARHPHAVRARAAGGGGRGARRGGSAHRGTRPRGRARPSAGAAVARPRRLRARSPPTGARRRQRARGPPSRRFAAVDRLAQRARARPRAPARTPPGRRAAAQRSRPHQRRGASALRLAGITAPASAVDGARAARPRAGRRRSTSRRSRPPTPTTPPRCLRAFAAADRRFSEYVRDEVFAELSPAELDFLVRTSMLDRLSGPLCDAVVDRTDSAATLDELARRTGLLLPLDGADRWYRHHRLFADALRARLAAHDPAVASTGHARASRWYAEAGEVEAAVVHAASAGDAGAAGALLFDSVASYVDADGRRPRPPLDRSVQRRRDPPVPGAGARRRTQRLDPRRPRPRRAPRRIAAAATDERCDAAAAAELHAGRARDARSRSAGTGSARMADDAARGGRATCRSTAPGPPGPACSRASRSSSSAAGTRRSSASGRARTGPRWMRRTSARCAWSSSPCSPTTAARTTTRRSSSRAPARTWTRPAAITARPKRSSSRCRP